MTLAFVLPFYGSSSVGAFLLFTFSDNRKRARCMRLSSIFIRSITRRPSSGGFIFIIATLHSTNWQNASDNKWLIRLGAFTFPTHIINLAWANLTPDPKGYKSSKTNTWGLRFGHCWGENEKHYKHCLHNAITELNKQHRHLQFNRSAVQSLLNIVNVNWINSEYYLKIYQSVSIIARRNRTSKRRMIIHDARFDRCWDKRRLQAFDANCVWFDWGVIRNQIRQQVVVGASLRHQHRIKLRINIG